MSNHSMPKKRHTLLRVFVTLLLASIIGLGGWFGLSLRRVNDLFGQASDAYAQMQASVEAEDYDAALTHARSAASLTSQASEELKGRQWDVAALVPVLGTDVKTMRSIGTISGTLADDAVLPALDSWDKLMGDGIVNDGTVDLNKVPEKLDQIVGLASTLKTAGTVVDECSEKANSLPTSRFGKINEWADSLRGTISSVDGLFDQFGVIADLVVGVAETFSSLTGGTSGA